MPPEEKAAEAPSPTPGPTRDPSLEVSVVVPAHRAEATLGACLDALGRQTLAASRLEVIVVDDASPDGTAALAEARGARVLRQPARRGPAAARNAGVRAARAPIVVFTDADCEPDPGFVEAIIAPLLADAGVCGAKGAYRSQQRPLVARFVQAEYEDRYDRMARERDRIDFIDTYAAAFRRADLLAVGGFDEGFPDASVEDQELAFRLAARGARLVFRPEAVVRHHGHADSLERYARKKFRIGFWKVAVLGRHPGKAVRDSHTPQVLKAQVVLAAAIGAALAGGAVRAALAGLAGAFAPFAALLGIFLLTTLPFAAKALRRAGPDVAAAAPYLLLLRAWALGLGLFWGLVKRPRLARPAPAPAAGSAS